MRSDSHSTTKLTTARIWINVDSEASAAVLQLSPHWAKTRSKGGFSALGMAAQVALMFSIMLLYSLVLAVVPGY